MLDSRSDVRDQRWILLACFLVAAALAVVYFDLSRVPAFNDDFVYRWSVSHFFRTHSLRMFPEDSALPYVQVIWSCLVSFGNDDPRVLRLTVFPFLVLLGATTYFAARELGALRAVALLAAVCVTCNPVILNLASTYMTDVVYLALEVAGIFATLRWSRTGKGGAWVVLAATLAPLQRQPGVALILGVATAAFFLWRSGRFGGRQRVTFALAMILPVAGLAAVMMASSNNVVAVTRITSSSDPLKLLQSWWYGDFLVWATVGILCLPLLAVSPSAGRRHTTTRRIVLYGAVLIFFGVVAVQWQRGVFNLIPGDQLSTVGLGPVHVRGIKPVIFHPLLLLPLLLVAGFAAWAEAVTIVRRLASSVKPAAAILVAFAASQVLVLAISGISDRYYLPVAAPLAILLAGRVVSLGNRAAGLRVAAALGAFLCLYVPGELDYQAWQAARAQAAQLAYSIAPPSKVDAGYEANGVYWELPLYDSTGVLPARNPDTQFSHAFIGPPCFSWALYLVRPSDPRAGFTYDSIVAGRVVIAAAPFEHPRCSLMVPP